MKLSQTAYDNSETHCCARLDAARFDEGIFEWKDKPFLKDHIRAFLHIPLNFGSVMTRNLAAVEKAEAFPEQPMWLTDESSPWGSDVYLAVDRAVPDTALVRLSGTFMTRVFEGPYRNLGRWIDEMKRHVAGKRRRLVHLYFFYATCPKCARRLGVNQVVLFAQVEDAAAKAA